jgi:hypothetical protein
MDFVVECAAAPTPRRVSLGLSTPRPDTNNARPWMDFPAREIFSETLPHSFTEKFPDEGHQVHAQPFNHRKLTINRSCNIEEGDELLDSFTAM